MAIITGDNQDNNLVGTSGDDMIDSPWGNDVPDGAGGIDALGRSGEK